MKTLQEGPVPLPDLPTHLVILVPGPVLATLLV